VIRRTEPYLVRGKPKICALGD
jgi:hypothetical protein